MLAGTDGSERAEEAVRRAAQLASATGAALDLVYVIDTSRPRDDADVEPKAEAVLHRAKAIAARTVPASARVVAGDPAEALVEEATEHASMRSASARTPGSSAGGSASGGSPHMSSGTPPARSW
jgi:nucleotide-binding universal stress UspA family protein